MLTRRPVFRCGSMDQSPRLSSTFFRIDGGRSNFLIQASHAPGSRRSRASLAFVRSLSMKALKKTHPLDSVDRSVTNLVAERMLVIPYADLLLIEASGSAGIYCWEEAWKSYMQRQTVALKELSAQVEACSPQIIEPGSSRDEPVLPHEFLSEVPSQTTCSKENICESPPRSWLSKLRAKKLRQRKARGLMLLNVLAALYGSTTVAGKFATDVAPGLPPSLSTLIRFSSALLVFLPVLSNMVRRGQHSPLLKAGAELGGLLFAAAFLETCGNGGASSDAPLLFAFTVIFVPIMELCAGRQSVRNISRVASLVALSGMGVLEEEGFGWRGVSLPQVGDVWGLAASAIYALHIFRTEAHSKRFKPVELTAIQCGTVASLALLWEALRVLHGSTTPAQYMSQLQSLPWGLLVYTGLVSSGLCSWLEIHGLRSVHASTATMVNTTIPIWGAFLSFFLRGEALEDSAMVGGSVILVASYFAQLLTNDDEDINPKLLDDNTRAPNPNVEVHPPADHVQGAILTSQLKFPYYAAQAKRLLLDAKFKLLSVKSLVISASSTLLSSPPLPPGSLHAGAPTAIVSAVTTGSQLTNHAAMAVQWLDIAAGFLESAITALGSDIVQEAEDLARLAEQALQVAMAHVAMTAASAASAGSANSVFLDTATRDFFQFVDTATAIATSTLNAGSQLPNHAAMAVQSSTTALSSQSVQATKDMARLAEQASQTVASACSVNCFVLDMATGAFFQFVDTATAIATCISLQALTPGHEFLDMARRALIRLVDAAAVSALAERSVVCVHHVDVPVLQIFLACGARSP